MMRRVSILLVAMLVANFLPVIAIAGSVSAAEESENFAVEWHLVRGGIIHKVWEIDMQNLTANKRDAYLGTFFSDTSFPIGQLKNVEFYEWKALQIEITVYEYDNVAENYTIENVLVYENVPSLAGENYQVFVGDREENNFGVFRVNWEDFEWYENVENVGAGYENLKQLDENTYLIEFTSWKVVGSHSETRMRCGWKPCKAQWFMQIGDTYEDGRGSITIPKLGSKAKYDNYGKVETENGVKKFRLEFDAPIQKREGGWGSSGLVRLKVDGVKHGSDYVGQPGSSWWDSDWPYRVPLTFNTHENVPENYQYRIVLDNTDNLGGHVAFENFQDLRFTENENIGELDFWFENHISGDNVVAWFERADNSLVDNTGYCYYGNASAGSAENGDATFPFFDHFPGSSVDAGKWTVYGSPSVSGSILTSGTGGTAGVTTISSWDSTHAFRARVTYQTAGSAASGYIGWSGAGQKVYKFDLYGNHPTEGVINALLNGATGFSMEHDGSAPHIYDAKRSGTSCEMVTDGTSKGTLTGGDGGSLYIHATGDGANAEIKIDWVLVRKYVSPEPTASVGVEEAVNVAPKTYDLDVGSTVDDDCVLYLNFDENTGQTENTVYDSSGENNHGTMENFQFENENTGWTTGYRGTALIFDGENDYVNCENDSSLNFGTGDFSVEAWINVKDFQAFESGIVAKYHSVNDVGFLLDVTEAAGPVNQVMFYVTDGLEWPTIRWNPLNLNEWYHVVGVREGNAISIYVNGVLRDADSSVGVLNVNNAEPVLIGYVPGQNYFDGAIDEVRAYNRALSADEIWNHYKRNWLRLIDFTPKISWSYYDPNSDNCENTQIQVGTTAGGNDLWDYQENSATTYIDYAGSGLTRGTTYYARTRTHDGQLWSDWTDNLEFRLNLVPISAIVAPPDAQANEGIQFTSDASDPDDDSLTYDWDFGDFVGTSTEQNPTYTFGSSGHYTVTLTVYDGYDYSVIASIIVNVTGAAAPPPGGGPGGPGGWVEQVAEEIEKVVQPAKNPLFTFQIFGVPIFFFLLVVGAITWIHKDRKGIHTMKGISYSIFMGVGFFLVMGAKLPLP